MDTLWHYNESITEKDIPENSGKVEVGARFRLCYAKHYSARRAETVERGDICVGYAYHIWCGDGHFVP